MPFNKIQSAGFDLTDNYAFTGTVSGAGDQADFVKLSTVDASSGTSAVIFNSSVVDSSTYKHFYLIGHRIYGSSNAVNFEFSVSDDNGSTFTNDNKRGQVYRNLYSGSSFGHEQSTTSNGKAVIGGSIANNTAGGSCNIWINGAGYSSWKYINYQFTFRHSGGEAYCTNGSWEQQNSSAYNYYKLTLSSGNIYGYYTLYGIRN
tara:strand:+ start:783 stop:1391 length:609 start_codon:yes stop_codon:yes gene_type:complete